MSEDSPSETSRPTSPGPSTQKPYRFQYAESTASRGPESVAGGEYFIGSRLDLAELTGAVEWTAVSQGFNAISTVLNNPHKTQAPPKAHSSLPPLPTVQLPRVRRKDFDSYLSTIGPEYDRFVKTLHESQEETVTDISNTATTAHLPPLDSVPRIFFKENFDLTNADTFKQVSSLLSGDEDVDPTSIAHTLPLQDALSAFADTTEAHLSHEIASRSSAFFAALSNLHTLRSSSAEALSRIRELRDKLKEVDENNVKKGLEVVNLEVRLNRIKSVQNGVNEVRGVVDKIGIMRGMADSGKWTEALNVLDEVETLWEPEGIPIKAPPRRGASARSPSSLSMPLSSLSAFNLLPSHLKSLSHQISKSLSEDLASVLKTDLENRIYDLTYVSSCREQLQPLITALLKTRGIKEAVLRWRQVVLVDVVRGVFDRHLPNISLEAAQENASSSQARDAFRALPHASFLSLLQALFRSLLQALESLSLQNKFLLSVIEAEYTRQSSTQKVPSKHRSQTLPIASPTPTSPLQPPLSPLLPPSSPRLSGPSSPRLGSHIIPLPPSSPTMPTPTSPGPRSPSPYSSAPSTISQQIQEELVDLLSKAAEDTNTLSSKVLLLHPSTSPPTFSPTSPIPPEPLHLEPFILTFTTSWSFILSGEVLSSRMIVGLRGVLTGLAKQWLSEMHKRNMSEVVGKGVEEELWNPVPNVGVAVQEEGVDWICESATRDLPALKVTPGGQPPSTADVTNGNPTGADAPPPRKHLEIEGTKFFLVPCTELLIKTLLQSYIRLIINIPILTIDSMSRVIEFLKMFNGRVCQVVLGAGAMRSAGLKNITAKHLALASQTLSILTTLIPYVREMFRRHLSTKQAIMLVEFDKLKRDYQEHQNEIHSKLIAIMGDRLSAHLRSLNAVDWTASVPVGRVNDYMVLLVKETTTLHKVLSRYLSSVVVEFVMSQVFAAINHRLSEEFSKIELPSEEAKTRLLTDARHIHKNLTELKGVGHVPTAMLEIVIQEKRVPRPPGVGTPTTPNHPLSPTPTNTQVFVASQQPHSPLSNKSPPPQPVEVKRSSTLNFGNTNARLKGLLSGHGLTRSNTSSPKPPSPPVDSKENLNGFRQFEAPKSPAMLPPLSNGSETIGSATPSELATPQSEFPPSRPASTNGVPPIVPGKSDAENGLGNEVVPKTSSTPPLTMDLNSSANDSHVKESNGDAATTSEATENTIHSPPQTELTNGTKEQLGTVDTPEVPAAESADA